MLFKRKNRYLILFIAALLVFAGFNWKKLLLKEIHIQFICSLPTVNELPYIKYAENGNDYDWFLVTQKNQYQNWISAGLGLPECDFSKNYLILSRYKIESLYYHPNYIDECCGAPPGFAELKSNKSERGKVYIYIMPKIMLSQGIG